MATMINAASGAAGVLLLTATNTSAQPTNTTPVERPAHSYLSISSSAPQVVPGMSGVQILFQIRSTSTTPIPIAVDYNHFGWTAYGAAGGVCAQMNIANAPILLNQNQLQVSDPNLFTAGVNRAALVPLRLMCEYKQGEEISYTATFFILMDHKWVPQQFSWQRVIVK